MHLFLYSRIYYAKFNVFFKFIYLVKLKIYQFVKFALIKYMRNLFKYVMHLKHNFKIPHYIHIHFSLNAVEIIYKKKCY